MAETAAQKRQRKIDELEGFRAPPVTAEEANTPIAAFDRRSPADRLTEQTAMRRRFNDGSTVAQTGGRVDQRRQLDAIKTGLDAGEDFAVAANRRFPSNQVAGLTTPPPQNIDELSTRVEAGASRFRDRPDEFRQPGNFVEPFSQEPPQQIAAPPGFNRGDIPGGEFVGRVADAFTRPVAEGPRGIGERARAVAGSLIGPPIEGVAELISEDIDRFGQDINDIGSAFGGFFNTAQADEPTGTRPVDTQGEVPTGDLQASTEDGAPRGQQPPGFPLDITDIESDVPADSLQATDSADPGQQSISAPPVASQDPSLDPIEVIRGTRQSTFFPRTGKTEGGELVRSTDPRAGFDVPRGMSLEDTKALTGFQNFGLSRRDAFDAMNAQAETVNRATNAGANQLRAAADSTQRIETSTGIVLARLALDDNGEASFSFIDTGLNQILEPKASSRTTVNALGERSTEGVLLYPAWNFETGEPILDQSGQQAVNAIPWDQLGIGENDEATKRLVEQYWGENSDDLTSDQIIENIQNRDFD